MRLIEHEGVGAVSMRRVAAELGAGTMSLYNHVPSKIALLDYAAEQIMADIEPYTVETDDWRDHMRAHARAVRDHARKHPRAFVLLATRRMSGDVGLRPIEVALMNLERAGFKGEVAVRVVRAMVSYLLGTLTREMATTPELGGVALSPYQPIDPEAFPRSSAVLDELGRYDHDMEFEFGLELMIKALEQYSEG